MKFEYKYTVNRMIFRYKNELLRQKIVKKRVDEIS